MAKGIKRRIRIAINNVSRRIEASARDESIFARGLAPEEYNSGYRDALLDISLLLDGCEPSFCRKHDFWQEK